MYNYSKLSKYDLINVSMSVISCKSGPPDQRIPFGDHLGEKGVEIYSCSGLILRKF